MAYRHFDRYAFPSGEAMYKGLEIDPTRPLVILDSDSIVYPTAFLAASKGWSCDETLRAVNASWESKMLQKRTFAGPEAQVVQFFTMSGTPKYRDQFINKVKYKENRKRSTVTPAWVPEIQNELITFSNSVFCEPALGEADDFISILSNEHYTHSTLPPAAYVVGEDKDLDTIFCNRIDKNGLRFVHHTTAEHNFYKQVLMGDSADNVKGLPGIGARKANHILDGNWGIAAYERVLKAYLEAHNYDEEEACAYLYETANLLYLRKDFDDYWNPPI